MQAWVKKRKGEALLLLNLHLNPNYTTLFTLNYIMILYYHIPKQKVQSNEFSAFHLPWPTSSATPGIWTSDLPNTNILSKLYPPSNVGTCVINPRWTQWSVRAACWYGFSWQLQLQPRVRFQRSRPGKNIRVLTFKVSNKPIQHRKWLQLFVITSRTRTGSRSGTDAAW